MPTIASTVTDIDDGQKQAFLKVNHPVEDTGYKLLAEAVASEHWAFTAAMIEAASKVARTPTNVSTDGINYALAFVASLKPQATGLPGPFLPRWRR